jgi:hypothetical protein
MTMTAIGEPAPLVSAEDFGRLAQEAAKAEAAVAKLVAAREAASTDPIGLVGLEDRDVPRALASEIRERRRMNVAEEQAAELRAQEALAATVIWQIGASAGRHSAESYLRAASLRPEAAPLVTRCTLAPPGELERFAERAAADGDITLGAAVDAAARSRELPAKTKDAIYAHLRRIAIPARTAAQEAAAKAQQAAGRALYQAARLRGDGAQALYWARRAEAPVW